MHEHASNGLSTRADNCAGNKDNPACLDRNSVSGIGTNESGVLSYLKRAYRKELAK